MSTKFVLDLEDGTSSGGNSRGVGSVDLQVSRSSASQVASGSYSAIVGGSDNTASSPYSVVGGIGCTAGQYGAAFGYYANSIGSSHAFAFGQSATASGNHSVAMGNGSNATGGRSFSTASSSASGELSVALASGRATGYGSIGIGEGSYSTLRGEFSVSAGYGIYVGANRFSQLCVPMNTGVVSSASTFTFTGAGNTSIFFEQANGEGVTPLNMYINATIVFGVRGAGAGVSTIATNDVFSVRYNLFSRKKVGGSRAILGTPQLINSFSDPSLSATTVNFAIGSSGQLLVSVTPPSFSGGNVHFEGTLNLEVTALGMHQTSP
jgi:hypothetical protein